MCVELIGMLLHFGKVFNIMGGIFKLSTIEMYLSVHGVIHSKGLLICLLCFQM